MKYLVLFLISLPAFADCGWPKDDAENQRCIDREELYFERMAQSAAQTDAVLFQMQMQNMNVNAIDQDLQALERELDRH